MFVTCDFCALTFKSNRIYTSKQLSVILANSVDPDQTSPSDQGLHCLHYYNEISTKDGNNENLPDTPYIGNGLAQTGEVEESTRHKWVKVYKYICIAVYTNGEKQ